MVRAPDQLASNELASGPNFLEGTVGGEYISVHDI